MQEVALFGCGYFVSKFIEILEYFQTEIKAIADNNQDKIGKKLGAIPIVKPEYLKQMEIPIIISSTYKEEILWQLKGMGIESRVTELKTFLSLKANTTLLRSCKPVTIGIERIDRPVWGGVEKWTLRVLEEMKSQNLPVKEFVSSEVQNTGSSIEEIEMVWKGNTLSSSVCMLGAHLPLILISSFFGELYLAAIILKILYPKQVKIISVVHGDQDETYKGHIIFESFIDTFVCVSTLIEKKLILKYGAPKDKVIWGGQCIKTDTKTLPKRSDGSVHIGFAARLSVASKRADLLSSFIEKLEKGKINYHLDIAGDGECLEELYAFIKANELEHKIHLLGYLDESEMEHFWEKQEIYVSFSENEGCSLAMLEAMNKGCVPVVTDVSGVRDYVEPGINGYIVSLGQLDEMAKAIAFLAENREEMYEMGKKAQKKVVENCDIKKYVKWLNHICIG